MENLLADHQDGKTNQATDTGICEEEADGTSEVDAQLEQKLIHAHKKRKLHSPNMGQMSIQLHEKPPRTVSTGYSLRKNPHPSRKLKFLKLGTSFSKEGRYNID